LGAPINTPWEEDFPVLHSDSITLYFSSKGHNSMGGYDIFKSVYDTTNKVFTTPVNMDFPINTPYNDYLYIADADDVYAYFASDRETNEDKISIYKIIIDKEPIPREFNNIDEIQQKSLLEVSPLADIKNAEQAANKNNNNSKSNLNISAQTYAKNKFNVIEYSPEITKSTIIEETEKDIKELKDQNQKYASQANDAYKIADIKNKEAEAKRQESANITASLNNYTDADAKEKKKEEAYKFLEEAERLEKEAVTAFNLAKNLDKNIVELNKDINKTENFNDALKTSTTVVSNEALTESLNQNRERLNTAQNKYLSLQEEASAKAIEAQVKEKELAHYKNESAKLDQEISTLESKSENLENEKETASEIRKEEINNQLFDIEQELAPITRIIT
jgi:hypothetical protein